MSRVLVVGARWPAARVGDGVVIGITAPPWRKLHREPLAARGVWPCCAAIAAGPHTAVLCADIEIGVIAMALARHLIDLKSIESVCGAGRVVPFAAATRRVVEAAVRGDDRRTSVGRKCRVMLVGVVQCHL